MSSSIFASVYRVKLPVAWAASHQAGDVVAAALLALALDLDRVPALPQAADGREDLLLVDKAVVFHPVHGVQRVVGEDAHEGRSPAESPPSKVWV